VLSTVHIERMAEAFLARDVFEAKQIALDLLDAGVGIGEVMTHLIAPAQARIGDRWHLNEASVADEHAATAVADAVVSVLTTITPPAAKGPHVVVACAEGEWHLLAARLLAETLRGDGFRISFLGGSMPAAHLARFLETTAPDVLAVSASTPLALEGVLAFVHVAHSAGVPVIAGGRALGSDDHRAHVLGADLWAPDALAASKSLQQPLPRVLNAPTADTGTAMEISLHAPALVAAAMSEFEMRFPAVLEYTPEQRARTREDFGYIIQFAQAALLTRDAGLFDDFLDWMTQLLVARRVPAEALTLALDTLTAVTGIRELEQLLRNARTANR